MVESKRLSVPHQLIQAMSEEVDAPWDGEIDVRDMTATDFQTRADAMALYDPDGEVMDVVSALVDAHDLPSQQVGDRAVRVYLAHLFDSTDTEYRMEYNVTTLIPPAGWVEHNRDLFPEVNPVEGQHDFGDQLMVSTPPAVKEMAQEVVDAEEFEHETHNAVLTAAVLFLARQD